MNIISAFRQLFFSKFYLLIPTSIIVLACLGSAAVYYIAIKGNSPLFFSNVSLCSSCHELFGVIVGTIPKRKFI